MCRLTHWLLVEALRAARAACVATVIAFTATAGWAAETPSTAAQAAAELPTETLALEVVANGVASDTIVVIRQGPIAWVTAADLRRVGISVPDAATRVPLNQIRGLDYRIDTATQTLELRFKAPRARVSVEAEPDSVVPVSRSGWGAVLNYDAVAQLRRREATISGLFEGVVYMPGGFAYTNAVAQTGNSRRHARLRRLDSGLTFADPDRTRRLTIGDYINGGNATSRPIRMAGIKVGTDFGLRPDLITFPLPTITGQAAVPSSVDLAINGTRVASRSVRAGDFSLSDVPIQTGLNAISVTVRDALGRQTMRNASIYTSAALLRPGLGAYSLEAGWVRTGFATEDDRYRAFATSGTGSFGVNNWLTVSGRFEASRDTAVIGGGAVIGFGRWGALDGSVMTSRSQGRFGRMFSLGWERLARPISLSARYTRSSDQFFDIARRYGSQTRRSLMTANIGFDLRRLGQVSISSLLLGRGYLGDGSASANRSFQRPLEAAHLLVGTYSVRVARHAAIVLNGGSDLRRRGSTFASVGLSATLGSRTSAYTGGTYRTGGMTGDAQVVKSALYAGDWGYRAQASVGNFNRVSGALEYLGSRGRALGEFESVDGVAAARLSARGAVVLAGGSTFFADRINDGFAIVDAAGERNIAVLRDNRPIGRTNAAGKLLVPNLPAYVTTKLSIDPATLDEAIAIDRSEMLVKPAERAGVTALPGIHRDRSVLLSLVDDSGKPLQVGSRVLLNGVAQDSPVGFDGLLFVQRPGEANVLQIGLGNGASCVARFTLPPGSRARSRIGPIACQADPPQRSPRQTASSAIPRSSFRLSTNEVSISRELHGFRSSGK